LHKFYLSKKPQSVFEGFELLRKLVFGAMQRLQLVEILNAETGVIVVLLNFRFNSHAMV